MAVLNATNSETRTPPLERLIGFDTIRRPFESWYAFVARLIRANLLTDVEIRRQVPPDWVRWAFAPDSVLPGDLATLGPYFRQLSKPEIKIRPGAWQPFPELSSSPPECLRICPRCIGDGYHSYAWQGDLIARCPVHHEPLTHHCPHCATQLLWQSRSPGLSAFQCPAGCLLLDGIHSGLYVPDELAITQALQEHWQWTQSLSAAITFVSGPMHIAYPPYLASAPLRMPPLPSKGLLPALMHALQSSGVTMPGFKPYHEQSRGHWTIEAKSWTWKESEPSTEYQLETYRRAFRRGAYRTHVPIATRAPIDAWLAASESAHGRWHGGEVEEGEHCSTLVLPSYLVTNNELTGLRRLLARGRDPELACAHYLQALVDLLEHARQRRIALDKLDHPSPHITVAESVDAIVRTAEGYWRLSGFTRGEDDSRASWLDYREPAEIAGGMIHIMRRSGPP